MIESNYVDRCNLIENEIKLLVSADRFKILDAGSGTGEYSIELAKRGHIVTGIDISSELLKIANQKIHNTTLKVRFKKSNLFEKDDNEYHAIICRGVLNDFLSSSDRYNAFVSFNNNLKKNGVLIFDVREWNKTLLKKKKEPLIRKSVETKLGTVEFTAETKIDEDRHELNINEVHTFNNKQYKS